MALESMTGFARAAGVSGRSSLGLGAPSVNGSGLDIRVRVPPGFERWRGGAQAIWPRRFARGTLPCRPAHSQRRRRRRGCASTRRRCRRWSRRSLACRAGSHPAASYDGLLAVRGVVELADEADETRSRAARSDLRWRASSGSSLALEAGAPAARAPRSRLF